MACKRVMRLRKDLSTHLSKRIQRQAEGVPGSVAEPAGGDCCVHQVLQHPVCSGVHAGIPAAVLARLC